MFKINSLHLKVGKNMDSINLYVKRACYALPVVVLVLSLLSATGLCMGGCSSLVNYRLFGTNFVVGGSIYALLLLGMTVVSFRWANWCHFSTDALLSGGLGAELWFIFIQKYTVKTWCPICLSIAGCLVVLVIVRVLRAFADRDDNIKGISHVKWFWRMFSNSFILFLAVLGGFSVAIVSVGVEKGKSPFSVRTAAGTTAAASKIASQDQAKIVGMATDDVWFGNKQGKYDVYFLSDWYCNYCREAEPVMEKMLPDLGKVARYTWLDYPIHQAAVGIVPYSVSVLLSDKEHYMSARYALFDLSKTDQKPQEMSIRSVLDRAGVKKTETDPRAIDVFQHGINLAKEVRVQVTPSVIIINRKTGAKKLLSGNSEITKENIFKVVGN